MPVRGESYTPAGDRIAGLMAEDLAKEASIDVLALVDGLQERGWTQTQIAQWLGGAVCQSYLRIHNRRIGEEERAAQPAPGSFVPSEISRFNRTTLPEHVLSPKPPKHGERDGDETLYVTGCAAHPGLPVQRVDTASIDGTRVGEPA